jgi:hypothetical protein
MLRSIDPQLSEMSPVVRQLLPTTPAHNAGLSTPHSTDMTLRYKSKRTIN